MSDLLPVLVADLANDAARKTLEEVAQAHGEAWVPLLAAPADISPHVLEIYTPDSPEPLRVMAQPLGAPNASGFPLRLHPLAREVAQSFHDDDSIRQSTRERVAAPLPIDAEDEETWAFSKAPVAAPPPPPNAEMRRDTPTATDLRHQVGPARREVPVNVSAKHAEELSGVKELPPDDPRGLVGRALAGGKLVIESLVGGGMMGAVYRAVHRELRIPVAVKVMHESFEKDVDFCRRFYAEALAVSRLDHPNLVRVLDFGQESDGVLYLAMEFLPGRSLRDVVRNEAPLKAPRIAQIMSQVCGALGHAHARGIIHRDVKPDNVLLLPAHDDDGNPIEQVKVCDFGLAIEAKDALRERFAGTPVYMSPEQCRGEELDARSDVYAVGVMLYELGTGTVPFLAETGDEVIHLHITAEARPMSDRVRDVDPRLERIVGRALRKAKGERYADMRELRADLKELATTVRFDLAEEAARMPVSEPGGYSVPPPAVPSMPPMPSVSLPPPAAPGAARVDARAETIPRVDTLPRDESFGRAETMPRISNVPPPPRASVEASEAPPPRPSTAPAWLEQKDESYAHFLTGMANSATQASEQVADILSREPTKWLAKLVAERDLRTYQKMLAELEIALRLLAKRADARAMWAASNVLHGLATDGSLGPGSRGQRAAMVLRLFADPAMLAPIAERMLARDDDAREAAKTLLTHAGTSGAYALYGARVKLANEPSVRNTFVLAIRALGEKGWPVVRAALERIPDAALVGKHPVAADLAEDLLFSVPAVRDEAAGHVVGKFVRARDPRLCRAATRALGVVWADRAQPIFLGLLSDRDDGIKFAAIAGLRQIGAIDEHVVRRLGQLFASPESSPELRVAIVTAFESATDEGRTLATPFLAQLVRDKAPDDATCLAAARSLQAHVGNEARAVIGDRADRSAEPLRSHLLALIATPTGNLADG